MLTLTWVCAKVLRLRIFTGKKNKNSKNQSYLFFHSDFVTFLIFFLSHELLLTLAQTYVKVDV
jgi:hypothetical protein